MAAIHVPEKRIVKNVLINKTLNWKYQKITLCVFLNLLISKSSHKPIGSTIAWNNGDMIWVDFQWTKRKTLMAA